LPVITLDLSVAHLQDDPNNVASRISGDKFAVLSSPLKIKGVQLQLNPPSGPIYSLDEVVSMYGYPYREVAIFNQNTKAGYTIDVQFGYETVIPTSLQPASAIRAASLYDYVITIAADGTITATPGDPNSGLVVVTGTFWDAVVNTCVTNIKATANGVGAIFTCANLLYPFQGTNGYPAQGGVDCQGVVGLFGEGGISATHPTTQIYWWAPSLAIGQAINNPTEVAGIYVNINPIAANSVSYGIVAGTTIFHDVQSFGAATYDIVATGTCRGDTVVCDRFNAGGGNSHWVNLVIGVRFYLVGNNASYRGSWAAITDTSNGTNYLENLHSAGGLVTPAVAGSVSNNKGTRVFIIISIGANATTVAKNSTNVLGAVAVTNTVVSIVLDEGDSLTLTQTVNVTWQWWAI
jgi:hypothetical protein